MNDTILKFTLMTSFIANHCHTNNYYYLLIISLLYSDMFMYMLLCLNYRMMDGFHFGGESRARC